MAQIPKSTVPIAHGWPPKPVDPDTWDAGLERLAELARHASAEDCNRVQRKIQLIVQARQTALQIGEAVRQAKEYLAQAEAAVQRLEVETARLKEKWQIMPSSPLENRLPHGVTMLEAFGLP
jgi:hypothetical protein